MPDGTIWLMPPVCFGVLPADPEDVVADAAGVRVEPLVADDATLAGWPLGDGLADELDDVHPAAAALTMSRPTTPDHRHR
ncbi:hypothetical protein [uncultured Jatrophihabitans sp.]|uniref:hypothetical protein n=1 Tax=uncultured Jatrophihabitans sp. TaxID=1610747 RepID=UPI0035CA4B3A